MAFNAEPRCGGMNAPPLEPPRPRQLRLISETDVWLRAAAVISADTIMINEIKVSQSGRRSPQEPRHQLGELKGLQHDYSARPSFAAAASGIAPTSTMPPRARGPRQVFEAAPSLCRDQIS